VGIGIATPLFTLDVAGLARIQNILFFDEGTSNGLLSFDQTNFTRKMRITGGHSDTNDGTEGASIDLYGNNSADLNGRFGTLNLFAGTTGNSWINANTFNQVDGTAKNNFQINPQGQVGIGTHDYVLERGDLPNNTQVIGDSVTVPNSRLTVFGNINNTLDATAARQQSDVQQIGRTQ
jgi:hypothetical protein